MRKVLIFALLCLATACTRRISNPMQDIDNFVKEFVDNSPEYKKGGSVYEAAKKEPDFQPKDIMVGDTVLLTQFQESGWGVHEDSLVNEHVVDSVGYDQDSSVIQIQFKGIFTVRVLTIPTDWRAGVAIKDSDSLRFNISGDNWYYEVDSVRAKKAFEQGNLFDLSIYDGRISLIKIGQKFNPSGYRIRFKRKK